MTKGQMWATIIAVVVVLPLSFAVVTASKQCEIDPYFELEFADGTDAVVRSDLIEYIIAAPRKEGFMHKVSFTGGSFVVVKDRLSSLQRRLCMKGY